MSRISYPDNAQQALPTPYQGLLRRLDECIAEATAAGLHSLAAIIRMAKLDLQTHAFGISDDELDTLLSAFEPAPSRIRMLNVEAKPQDA